MNEEKCNGCGICVKICPVEAITLIREGGGRLATVDEQRCLDCTLCTLRCPQYAVTMVDRDSPLQVGVNMNDVSEEEVAQICHGAHMYPDQLVCFCHRVKAKEVVASILQGAKTPEDISRATGARTGCGVLCATGIIRLLRAAGVELTKAPGYQWYGIDVSIWSLPPKIHKKYGRQYFLKEDLQVINKFYPGGE